MKLKGKFVGVIMATMVLGNIVVAKADMGYYVSHDFYFKNANAKQYMYVDYLSRIGKDKVSYKIGIYGKDKEDVYSTVPVYTIDKRNVNSVDKYIIGKRIVYGAEGVDKYGLVYNKSVKVSDAKGIVAKALIDSNTEYVCDMK